MLHKILATTSNIIGFKKSHPKAKGIPHQNFHFLFY